MLGEGESANQISTRKSTYKINLRIANGFNYASPLMFVYFGVKIWENVPSVYNDNSATLLVRHMQYNW